MVKTDEIPDSMKILREVLIKEMWNQIKLLSRWKGREKEEECAFFYSEENRGWGLVTIVFQNWA